MSQLKKWIKTEEGFSEKVYTCIQGVPTIGYGFTSLSEDEADVILDIKIQKLRFKVEAFLIAQKINLDSFRKDVLIDMAYQLGFYGMAKFTKMLSALKDMDYDKAAEEMLDSVWCDQTPERCKLLASRMKNGY